MTLKPGTHAGQRAATQPQSVRLPFSSDRLRLPGRHGGSHATPEMDSLRLLDIECRSRIGVTPEERVRPQSIRVDLNLSLDLEAAGNSDSIDLAVDYVKVVGRVQAIATEREYRLVEALARTLCRRMLQENPVDRVQVTVRKRPEELKGKLREVAVTMTRPA